MTASLPSTITTVLNSTLLSDDVSLLNLTLSPTTVNSRHVQSIKVAVSTEVTEDLKVTLKGADKARLLWVRVLSGGTAKIQVSHIKSASSATPASLDNYFPLVPGGLMIMALDPTNDPAPKMYFKNTSGSDVAIIEYGVLGTY